MRRGVLLGVIAFGVGVSLAAFVLALADGMRLGRAAWIAALIFAGLVLFPLRYVAFTKPRGDARDTAPVALATFGVLAAVSGVLLGLVGGARLLVPAGALLVLGIGVIAAGAWVERSRAREPRADVMRWHG
jgi:hypothetical protein